MTEDPTHVQAMARNARDWALLQLGSVAYPYLCLAFVEDAYEIANGIEIFGGSTAKESADLYGVRQDRDPPLGSFVFYDCIGTLNGERKNWGHVGLAIGGGLVIHAWKEIRVDPYLAVEDLPAGDDWEQPEYIGYAPPEVILKDHELVEFDVEDDLLEDFFDEEEALLEMWDTSGLSREKLLAAEVYGYSYFHYADHAGNLRFDRLMPEDVRILERAEQEGWDAKRLAEALEISEEEVALWQKLFRAAKDIVDAPTAAESFRRGVRHSIRYAVEEGLEDEGSIERLVTQICYRAADLAFLLDMEGRALYEYSTELRKESEYDAAYWDEVIRGHGEEMLDEEEDEEDEEDS
ncbi:MAG: hypothetical protein ACP5JG_17730 [Anaerolineae bacterium]